MLTAMLTKAEFYSSIRQMLVFHADLQLRVAVLEKTLEMKGVMDSRWVELQIAQLKKEGEYLRAMAAIKALGDEPEKSLDEILRDFRGPIQ